VRSKADVSKKTDMLRSIGKQSGGIRGVSPEEDKESYAVERIYRKGKF